MMTIDNHDDGYRDDFDIGNIYNNDSSYGNDRF